jgi:hypothetical protein
MNEGLRRARADKRRARNKEQSSVVVVALVIRF